MVRFSRSWVAVSVVGLFAVGCGEPTIHDLAAVETVEPPEDVPETGSFTLSADGAKTLDLDQEVAVAFTLTPLNGYTGEVAVSLPTNPSGARAVSVVVPLFGSPVTGQIVVDTKDVRNVFPGRHELPVQAVSGDQSSQSILSLTIEPRITIGIPAGAGNASRSDVWGPDATGDGLVVHMGRTATGEINTDFVVRWRNDDGVAHIIHGGGTAAEIGLGHGPNGDTNADPGQTQQRTLRPELDPSDPTASYLVQPSDFYCHSHGTGQRGKIRLLH